MHIQTPANRPAFHSEMLRATRACQALRAAVIDIETIATPEGASEKRALKLLKRNVYASILLLAVISECSVDRMSEDALPNLGFQSTAGGSQ